MNADSGHVLIVDADATRREILSWQLAELGYAVTPAESGGAALEAVSARAADLVMVDASMPVETIAELRRAERLRDAPLLLITREESELKEGLEWADDFLRRPFSPALLKVRLKSLIKHSDREDKLRVERDIQIAREIQRGFLPQELPNLPGWQIATRFIPAYEVAGDFYDVFFLTNKIRTGFVVADVCDKGIGAALFMGLSRSLLRAFAQQNYTINWADLLSDDQPALKGRRPGKTGVGVTALKNAVTLTNNYIATIHGQSNMFATLFFGVLDPATGLVNYVNAGHNPPLIVSADNEVKAHLTRTGPAVGMFPDVEFGIEQAQLETGDTLLAFTDGVTEARSTTGELFSDDRLEALMASAPPSADQMLDHIQNALKQHVGDAPQSDDITLLAMRRESVSEV